jgi:hypothetical protein
LTGILRPPSERRHGLELGDRVRVVAPRSRMDELGRFFGSPFAL